MSVSHLRVVPRAGAPHHPRAVILAKALKRFRPQIRGGVAQLARRHVRLAELAESFPALLAALAWPRAGFDARPVIHGVIGGAPLTMLAEQAGVPLWLRKMPTEMLVAPLPLLPDSTFVRHRIINHFPKHERHAPRWFAAVSSAAQWADEEFAVWQAHAYVTETVRRRRRHRVPDNSQHLLELWTWFSGQPGTVGHALIASPWTPQMQQKAALEALSAWRGTLELVLNLGVRPIADTWLKPGHADGYDFVPIASAADLAAEGRAMNNCVRTYAGDIALDYSRLWSVRKDGQRVATLEVQRNGQIPFPVLNELRLTGNGEPSTALWLAARAWLNGQAPQVFSRPAPMWHESDLDAAMWRALWKPYWTAKRRVPSWLPLRASREAFAAL